MAVRIKGTIKSWNADKGFGFISPSSGGKDLFLHITSLHQRGRTPRVGESVTYTLSKDKQNRPCAVDATFDGEERQGKTKQPKGSSALVIAALFLLFVAAVAYTGHLPVPVLWFYLAASFITLMVYWKDKSAARKGEWRTPESTLHSLALVGGWPGALVAQSLLRHKSSKTSFRVVFFTTVFLNIAALLWTFTPMGSAMLNELLAFLFMGLTEARLIQ
jgi:uncharacterized membrane protein YsdA (DUF1294 family)/cold shock CspA family protein